MKQEPVRHVAVGVAADTICDVAEAHGADLIVAGSRGLSGLNRLMMGTTVEKVIRRARTSVLTVPGRCPGDDVTVWGPVIAAIDDPARPQPVAGAAASLARALEAPLHLVHARADAAQRTLTATLREFEGLEPENVHIASGPVADALAAEASRHT